MSRKTIQNTTWDEEWAQDWQRIVAVYDGIDKLLVAFKALETDLPYLRVLAQHQLILNLEKYAWSLQALIISKYRD
ncbi:MAG: hypothetical protein RBG13Loki_2470 [Promethearchaeota archaeon CR_4]|nr:MAG: hypothetical protein RBG13Loki_2470 [Candidatus Lokiarchaeota archaeon CR_4]